MADAQPSMYWALADWFHLITAPEDYVEDMELFVELIRVMGETSD